MVKDSIVDTYGLQKHRENTEFSETQGEYHAI